MEERDQRGEFVAAQPGQHIAAQQLAAHAQGNLLEVKVSRMVAEHIIDRLELVEVDIDQSEDSSGLARNFDCNSMNFSIAKAVGNIGKQVVLRAAAQIGVEPPGLDGERGQPRPRCGELRFHGRSAASFGSSPAKSGAERRTDASIDARAGDAQAVLLQRAIAKPSLSAISHSAWTPCNEEDTIAQSARGSRRVAAIR